MSDEPDSLFDASAVLAILFDEPGSARAREFLPARISAVNASEVLTKLVQHGMTLDTAAAAFEALRLEVVDFTAVEAVEAVRFVRPGLSLGDRACLATARILHATAVTADRSWRSHNLPVKLAVVR